MNRHKTEVSHKLLRRFSDENRQRMTPSESKLWTYLKPLGFEAQVPLKGRYIVDFYHSIDKLIIEVDGPYHENPKQLLKDSKRDKLLSKFYKVLRFTNHLVLSNTEYILEQIKEYLSNTKKIPLQVKKLHKEQNFEAFNDLKRRQREWYIIHKKRIPKSLR